MRGLAQRPGALRRHSHYYPSDLLPQLQSTLAALADVEFRYDVLQERLAATLQATAHRELLLRWLERKRNQEREPLQVKLAELHERVVCATAAQNLRLAG